MKCLDSEVTLACLCIVQALLYMYFVNLALKVVWDAQARAFLPMVPRSIPLAPHTALTRPCKGLCVQPAMLPWVASAHTVTSQHSGIRSILSCADFVLLASMLETHIDVSIDAVLRYHDKLCPGLVKLHTSATARKVHNSQGV